MLRRKITSKNSLTHTPIPVPPKNIPICVQHLALKPVLHLDKWLPTDMDAANVCRQAAVCPGGGRGPDTGSNKHKQGRFHCRPVIFMALSSNTSGFVNFFVLNTAVSTCAEGHVAT